MDFTFFERVEDLVAEITPDSIVSRTIFKSPGLKVILFAFDAGQSLSEHSASQTAVVHVLRGEAALTLGAESREAAAGAWLQMPPRLKHSVYARTPLLMLLYLVQAGEGE